MTSQLGFRRVFWQMFRNSSPSWMIVVAGTVFCIAVLAVTARAYELKVRWSSGSLELTRSKDTPNLNDPNNNISAP